MSNEVKYSNIEVELSRNQDGNAMMIIGEVSKELRKNRVPQSEISEFVDEATSGDYNNVLRTCMRWVNVV